SGLALRGRRAVAPRPAAGWRPPRAGRSAGACRRGPRDGTPHRPPGLLAPSGGVDRFVRVRDETLRAAEGARHVEATIEVPEVLRGLDRLLERGFREPKRRRETLELPLIDLALRHDVPPGSRP